MSKADRWSAQAGLVPGDGRSEYCIEVSDLSKHYGSIRAIDGVSFKVRYGKVFGFLGPNGAGKTTTIKVLTTLVRPSAGAVRIFGQDIVKHSKEIKKRIGVVLQEPSFEANLTVEKALNLYGMMWGVPREKRAERVASLQRKFDLEGFKNMKNDELSIGQRRRVQVAREFMHDMDLIFLDEPTVGLDPAARRTMLDYIKRLVQEGLTVFFTTHIMEEAEYLCDEIAIINKGKIIAIDTPVGLKQKYSGVKAIEIRLKDIRDESILKFIEPVVTGESKIESAADGLIRISSREAQDMLVKTIKVLAENGVQIESASVTPPSLEQVFLEIVNGHKKD